MVAGRLPTLPLLHGINHEWVRTYAEQADRIGILCSPPGRARGEYRRSGRGDSVVGIERWGDHEEGFVQGGDEGGGERSGHGDNFGTVGGANLSLCYGNLHACVDGYFGDVAIVEYDCSIFGEFVAVRLRDIGVGSGGHCGACDD